MATQSLPQLDTSKSESLSSNKTYDDGYNWHKYEQKKVTGSETSRGYFICTYPNCLTKKVETSFVNGQITEIVYKENHNHPKPQSTKRSDSSAVAAQNSSHGNGQDIGEDETDAEIWKRKENSRVVIQTTSDIDILEDGYKWRKYGQIFAKGNTNPRSYYKCKFTGCCVKKHVERAVQDPKSVITTYLGKHNHEIPTQEEIIRPQVFERIAHIS